MADLENNSNHSNHTKKEEESTHSTTNTNKAIEEDQCIFIEHAKLDKSHQSNYKYGMDRNASIVHYIGEESTPSNKEVNNPVFIVSNVAHIKTKSKILDILWLMSITLLTPAFFAVLWFGIIPLGNADGGTSDKAVWVFIINPGTYVFFSYMLINIFLACLDSSRPWRPFKNYVFILFLNYMAQVGIIGTIVLLYGSFSGLGIVCITISVIVTLIGLYLTPHGYFDDNKDRYYHRLHVFKKILICFLTLWIILLAYILANATSSGVGQGFLTVALTIITFIYKKIFLAFTDVYPIEVAMVISGLWLENLVDLFIFLAYPTAVQIGATYVVIWISRVGENVAYLGFQLDIWFKFRVWIKGKFKKSQREIFEEDIDPDDRGHSNQHPGYRRRQARFLIWKMISQFSSAIVFLVLIPTLRFGINSESYPYSNKKINLSDVKLEETLEPFSNDTFIAAMVFAVFCFFSSVVSFFIIHLWMQYYHKVILDSLGERYKYLIVSDTYFGFVLTILISNVLLAVSVVQLDNRLYFF